METKDQLQYKDFRLAKSLGNAYLDMINYDVEKPPYEPRSNPDSYFLIKRKGYRVKFIEDQDCDFILPNWSATDKATVTGSDGTIYDIFYATRNDGTQRNIYRNDIAAGCCLENTGDFGGNCPDAYDRFTIVDFVKGESVQLFNTPPDEESTTGIEKNRTTSKYIQNNLTTNTIQTQSSTVNQANVQDFNYTQIDTSNEIIQSTRYTLPPEGRFSDENVVPNGGWNRNNGPDSVNVGYYIRAYAVDETAPLGVGQILGIPLQVNRITGIDGNDLLIEGTWAGFDVGQFEGYKIIYRIYPDRGEIPVYAGSNGIVALHDVTSNDYTEFGETGSCPSSIANYGGYVTYFDKATGRLYYGRTGYLKFYYPSNQWTYIGTNTITVTEYSGFLLSFEPGRIRATVISVDALGNVVADTQTIHTTIGIWSKNAYTQYSNSFYFIGSDKEIYAVNITKDANGRFILDLKPQADQIKGHLDLLQTGDQVSISIDNKNMKIFINGDSDDGTGVLTKTKILIFWKDKEIWTTHVSCCEVISRQVGDTFLGETIYSYCGDYDGLDHCSIDTKIRLQITEETIQVIKKLKWLKILLGIYTDISPDNTTLNITTHYNGFAPIFTIDDLSRLDYIDNIATIHDGGEINISDCMNNQLSVCQNYKQPCPYVSDVPEVIPDPDGNCPCDPEEPVRDDYCVCTSDNSFALSKFANILVELPAKGMVGEMFTVTLETTSTDRLEFGGIIAVYQQERPEFAVQDSGNRLICDKCERDSDCDCE